MRIFYVLSLILFLCVAPVMAQVKTPPQSTVSQSQLEELLNKTDPSEMVEGLGKVWKLLTPQQVEQVNRVVSAHIQKIMIKYIEQMSKKLQERTTGNIPLGLPGQTIVFVDQGDLPERGASKAVPEERPSPLSPRSVLTLQHRSGVYSNYLGTSANAIFADEPVYQQGTSLRWEHGVTTWWLEVWTSNAWKNFRKEFLTTYGYEADVTAGFAYTGKVRVVLNITYMAVVASAKSDIINTNFEIAKKLKPGNRHTFQTFLRVEGYFPTNGQGPSEGLFVFSGLRHRYDIGSLSFNESVKLGWDPLGAFGFKPRSHTYTFEVNPMIRLSKTVSAGLIFQLAGTFDDPARRTVHRFGGVVDITKVIFQKK